MVDSSTMVGETPPVFEHQMRTDWGVAVVAWEADGKRGYLFSDGELRVVASGYYDLMREVIRPFDEIQPLLELLAKTAGERTQAPAVNPSGFGFEDQLDYFLSQYPGGFASPAWQHERRGKDAPRRLKRHRDAAVTDAQARLARASVESRLSEHRYAELWQDLIQVAKGTDLVTAKCVSAISTDDPTRLAELAKALRHVLYGDGSFDSRLQRFVKACRDASKKDVSWQLVTLAPALVFPSEHVCVQPASFREQARWLVPRLARLQSPTAAGYHQLLEMARLVAKKLGEAGVPPQDMLDVADFIRVTTGPSARKAMLARKNDASKPPPSGHGGAEAA